MTKETVRILQWDTGEGKVYPVPVRELVGDAKGPTLVLIAGEHGIELAGPPGIDLVCRELLDTKFAGTVLAVPSIAPCNIAYRNHTFGQPHGEGYTFDMPYNSYPRWPGKADGDPAQRLCHLIWTEVCSRADVVLNFHAWSRNSSGCFFASDKVAGNRELAIAFNGPFYELSEIDGMFLHGAMAKAGKRAALIELSGQWRVEPDSLQRVRRGIFNVMSHLGMIDRAMEMPLPQFQVGPEEGIVSAPSAGLFIPLKQLEQLVAKGELVGYLLDLDTGKRTDIHSPIDGAVWLCARTGGAADVQFRGMHAYADKGDLLLLVKKVIKA